MGEPVQEADGRVATVEAVHVVPGAASMWDLTVSNVHDFAVGTGAFVVHNCGASPQQSEIISKVYSNASDAFDEVKRQLGGVDDLTEQTTNSLGDYKGLPNGYTSPDGERSWRLDYDPNSGKGLHFNWMDSTGGGKGSGARWGAVRMLGNERTYDSMLGELLNDDRDAAIQGMLR